MGTRADFYVGRGETAEWIGSIAWDGNPGGLPLEFTGAKTEAAFRSAVVQLLESRDDATLPEHGWPWPWDDSETTDYAYAFDDGAVLASCFGSPWWPAAGEEPPDADRIQGPPARFPKMQRGRPAPAGSKRSGVMVLGMPAQAPSAPWCHADTLELREAMDGALKAWKRDAAAGDGIAEGDVAALERADRILAKLNASLQGAGS